MSINEFTIEAKGEPPTHESLGEFLVSKNYFKRNGKDFEKMYSLGKDFRECLMLKINYTPGTGAFVSWHLFEIARKGTIIDASGKPTMMFKEFERLAERMKDVSMILKDDLKDIEKFLKG